MLYVVTVFLNHMVDNLIVGLGYSLLVFTRGWKWPGLFLLGLYGFFLFNAYTHAALICVLVTAALVQVIGLGVRRIRRKSRG